MLVFRSLAVVALTAVLAAFAAPAFAEKCVPTIGLTQMELNAPEGRIYGVRHDGRFRSAVTYRTKDDWVIALGNEIPAEGTAINVQGDGMRCDNLAAAEDWIKRHSATLRADPTPRKKVAVAPCHLDRALTAVVKDHPYPFSEGHRGEVRVVARGGPWLASVDVRGNWTTLVGTYYDRRTVDQDTVGDRAPPVLILSARQVYTCDTSAAADKLYAAEVAKARSMPPAAGVKYWTSEDETRRFKDP